ncbi:MAG: methyltransferase domain-containing protein [Clostridia bacterium]|nr:methyltransferase domain-containing protein [Clostridia bacterium]
MKGVTEAYRALCDVYIRGSYVGEAVKAHSLSACPAALRLVYGTIEHHYLYEYRLGKLSEKSPKTAVAILLKMGMYLIDFMDDIPNQVAVNEIVRTAKNAGKAQLAGFINAVLRRYAESGKDILPTDAIERLSVDSNRPIWLVKRYIGECGKEKALEILSTKGSVKTHVRPSRAFGKDALRRYLEENAIEFVETPYGFLLSKVGRLASLFGEGKATVMSLGSLEICDAVPEVKGDILDMCAAPGGKAVYLAERTEGRIIACDLHPHRVELIRAYAERMKVRNIELRVADHTIYDPSLKERFSVVLLDAPCSGLGTLASNPDVILHRAEADLDEIIRTQKALLENASKYMKEGGTLVYSTCSDLPSENEEMVKDFLLSHPEMRLAREKSMRTDTSGGEGYYYAVLEKK